MVESSPPRRPVAGVVAWIGAAALVACTAEGRDERSVAPTEALGAARQYGGGPAPLGTPCVAAAECASGRCVDGVCCDTPCFGGSTSDCRACSVEAGAAQDGVCSVIAADVGRVCRPARSECDLPEVCDGASGFCPEDEFLGPEVSCADDGNACTENERCLFGECLPSTAIGCGSANPCIDAYCDPIERCVTEPLTGTPCPVDDLCSVGVCLDGECETAGPADCDDGEECTVDGCDGARGCTHAPVDDGVPCGRAGSCAAGVCIDGLGGGGGQGGGDGGAGGDAPGGGGGGLGPGGPGGGAAGTGGGGSGPGGGGAGAGGGGGRSGTGSGGSGASAGGGSSSTGDDASASSGSSGPVASSSGAGAGGGTTSSAGDGEVTGSNVSGAGGAGERAATADGGGCDCAVSDRSSRHVPSMIVAALVAVVLRRRRGPTT